MTATPTHTPAELFDPRASADANRRRAALCRAVIYAAPVLMAALTFSVLWLLTSSPGPLQALFPIVVWTNAALAVFASAGGTALLSGRQGLRLAGAGAYALLAFIIYMALTIAGIITLSPG